MMIKQNDEAESFETLEPKKDNKLITASAYWLCTTEIAFLVGIILKTATSRFRLKMWGINQI